MKRTDKYRDSYKYDDQYQNHRKRSEEDMYRQHQESQQRANSNRATQSEMIESMKIILNVITMEETIDVSSNWKKKMKNQAKLKMADCNHSYFTHYCSYLYHACNYQS